jgi:glyoxylase-like metal-dependent hydrolase (beta-lactamase superfamily II)
MKIGPYTLSTIVTSEFALDGGAMFGVVPKTLWNKVAPADALNRIPMVTRTLLIESEDRKILVDTGNGDKWTEKFKKIYNINWDKYSLRQGLKKKGIEPEDITDVICTHLHFDHAGGNTHYENGKIVATFPNAKYWVREANLVLANSPTEKDQASYLSENWDVLAENDMIHILKDDIIFMPGINFIVVDGHTRGQQLLLISDTSTTLLYGGDLFPMAPHLSVPWVMAYDIDPLRTIQEKKIVLPKATLEQWIIFYEHDPYIEASRVIENKNGFSAGETIEM